MFQLDWRILTGTPNYCGTGICSLCLLVLIMLSGCGSTPVALQYDEAYDFNKVHTYSFVSREQMQANFLLTDVQRNRIEYAIEQQLDAHGLRYAKRASAADVLISYTLVNHHHLIGGKQLSYCDFCETGAMTNPQGQQRSQRKQRDGTMVLTMMDSQSKQRIWQVSLAANLLQNNKNELNKERLEHAIAELFTQWPLRNPGLKSE